MERWLQMMLWDPGPDLPGRQYKTCFCMHQAIILYCYSEEQPLCNIGSVTTFLVCLWVLL